jgi:hypothetical protein
MGAPRLLHGFSSPFPVQQPLKGLTMKMLDKIIKSMTKTDADVKVKVTNKSKKVAMPRC